MTASRSHQPRLPIRTPPVNSMNATPAALDYRLRSNSARLPVAVVIGVMMLAAGVTTAAHAQQDPDLAAARQAIGDANPSAMGGGAAPVGDTGAAPVGTDQTGGQPNASGPTEPSPGDLQNLPQPDLDAIARAEIARQAIRRIDALSGAALTTFDPADLVNRLNSSAEAVGKWVGKAPNSTSPNKP